MLSLAVLADTGWYSPVMTLAEPLWWGRGRTGQFLSSNPTTSIDPSSIYDCDPSQAHLRCAVDRRYKGYCSPSMDPSPSDGSLNVDLNAVWPLPRIGSCLTRSRSDVRFFCIDRRRPTPLSCLDCQIGTRRSRYKKETNVGTQKALGVPKPNRCTEDLL